MKREKTKQRLERARNALEKAKKDIDKYGHELDEIDKNDFWRTARKYKISPEELKELIAIRDRENKAILNDTQSGETGEKSKKEETINEYAETDA